MCNTQNSIIIYWLVVQNAWCVFVIKGLSIQNMLKLIHPVRGVVHVGGQVTVQEAEHVTIEGQPDRHTPFVTLKSKKIKDDLQLWKGFHVARA